MKRHSFFFTLLIAFVFFSVVCCGQSGIITTVVGNGTAGYGGDGGPATAAMLHNPMGVCTDAFGNIYIADQYNHRIRKVNSAGIITTIAGNGTVGFSGDGGLATAAKLSYPQGVAIDQIGNIYIADFGNGRIRKINSLGIISTVAGGDTTGAIGDGGPATSAYISGPAALAFDLSGNMYIAAEDAYVVRKVNTSGIISTFAGDYVQYYTGDGGPAISADLYNPTSVAVDGSGNVYIADWYGMRVRQVNLSGIINDVAGLEGGTGCSCTSGPATNISMNPQSVTLDGLGNMYISDYFNYVVWKVNTSGIASIYAGVYGGGGSYSDGVPATSASLGSLSGIFMDVFGNGYIAVQNKIRKISASPNYISDSFSVYVENNCSGIQFQLITNRYLPGQHIKTYFGNGLNVDTSTTLYGTSGVVSFFEPFSFCGTYTIKHVLYDGITAIDSITYSRSVSLCQKLAIGFYNDALGTCVYNDSGDHLMQLPVLVEVDSNSIPVDTLSTTSGLFYTAYGSAGDIYSFKVISNPQGVYVTCPSSGTIFDTLFTDTKTTKYFGFSCSSVSGFDLAENVSIITGRHMASGNIITYNNYCTPENAVVAMNIDPKYIFEGSYPVPTSVVGNTVTWDVNTVMAFSPLRLIQFSLTVPTSAWLTPGDTVQSSYIVTPIFGDLDTSNNIVIRNDTIKGSWDPNEMSVTPGGYISSGTKLQYTIQFENTGNDTAFNISVYDTLSDNVDVHSMRIIAASAVMNTAILNYSGHNIVKFDFPGINLLDSSHHNQCNGMVLFNINTKSSLPIGTTIFNHAGIFFDDNPVVMTDTVEDIIGIPTTGITTISNAAKVAIYPNPANDELTIRIDNGSYNTATITNVFGQQVISQTLIASQTKLDVSKLPAGMYYVTLRGESGVKVLTFEKM